MAEGAKVPARRYADHEIKVGLAALLYAGTLTKASEQTGIPKTTLKYWRDTKPEMWSEVQTQIAPKLDKLVLDQARELAVTWAELETQVAQHLAEALPRLDSRDIPAAARNISTARAISVDKLNILSGRPTAIVEHRSTTELVSHLGGYVDGTIDEIE